MTSADDDPGNPASPRGGAAGPGPADPDVLTVLSQDPVIVAPSLLGWTLHSRIGGDVILRITEVEAYRGVGADPGSHAHRGRTGRNASMFARPGTAYVYFSYGMHWCLNVVAHAPGEAGAVLIRAGEVRGGVPCARARRTSAKTDRDLARGPARLAAALGVDGRADGLDLLDQGGQLLLTPATAVPTYGSTQDAQVQRGPRTGVAGAGAAHPWRFHLADDPTVSPYRAATPRGRAASRAAKPPQA